ncbi:unnamed protein product [Pipistrellus nathusii]|uniref:Uncharacterized protein n=1 Tax=Pipistrellus nathusii TaxID=59473 RepID=A0ABP0AHI3_PIPNA
MSEWSCLGRTEENWKSGARKQMHPHRRSWKGGLPPFSVSACLVMSRDPLGSSKGPRTLSLSVHFLQQSLGRFLKLQSLTLKIGHKLAAFLRLPAICLSLNLLLKFLLSQLGTVGSKGVNGIVVAFKRLQSFLEGTFCGPSPGILF